MTLSRDSVGRICILLPRVYPQVTHSIPLLIIIGGDFLLNLEQLISDFEACIGFPYASPGTNDARGIDCSGMFVRAFRRQGASIYHGSNTMFRRYSSASGSLSAGKRTDGEPLKPGTAVYKFNASEGYHHVGLYIGEGAVIEAKGTAYGVVTSKIGSGWTHWGELKGVDYAEKGEQIAMSETKLAVVTTASGSLNMRKTASKSAEVITKIPQGATVTVLMEADDWWRVQYKNSTGWCAAEFLTKQENADNQARRSIQIVDSAGNVFEPVGDFTVKVANADVGDS